MPKIVSEHGAARIKAELGRSLYLSGGFGSEVNKIIRADGGEYDDVIQKGSKLIAPLHVPRVVEQVHQAYAAAGADILTADTFCASVSRQNGDARLIKKFIKEATAIASAVSFQNGRHQCVAVSLTASGDCYSPEDTPDEATLIQEHRQNIEMINPYGDFLLAETLPTLREARVIADIAQKTETPFLVAFTVGEQGQVLDGASMQDVVEAVLKPHSYCLGLGVNCCSIAGAENAVHELGRLFHDNGGFNDRQIAVYPNGFKKTIDENEELSACGHAHAPEVYSPIEFAGILQRMEEKGATMVGGCCGTTPKHTDKYSAGGRKPVLTAPRSGYTGTNLCTP